MEYKQAISVLTKMLDEGTLDAEQKEAVLTAIGVLDWAALGKNRFKSMMEKRKDKPGKSAEW